MCTEEVPVVFLKCVFVQFVSCLKQEGEPVDRWVGPERKRVRNERTDAPLERWEAGREQNDGGNERKSKQENQENKNVHTGLY